MKKLIPKLTVLAVTYILPFFASFVNLLFIQSKENDSVYFNTKPLSVFAINF